MDPWKDFMEIQFWNKLQKPSSIGKLEWKAMSNHPFLKKEMVSTLPHGNWDWRILSRKDWCKDLLVQYPYKRWDWSFLSYQMPYSFIRSHPYFPWDLKMIWKRFDQKKPLPARSFFNWNRLSLESSTSFIFSHLRFPWNWKLVSKNPSLCLGDVCNYPGFSWDFSYIMTNVYFSGIDLQRKGVLFEFKLLSLNPYCRPWIVRQFINKDWDWSKLASHPAFPPSEIIHDSKLAPKWRWDRCLSNPRLSYTFYHDIRRSVFIPNHFIQLSQNHFQKSVLLFPYQLSILIRFLWICFVRKKILHKIKLLVQVKKHFDLYIFQQKICSYI